MNHLWNNIILAGEINFLDYLKIKSKFKMAAIVIFKTILITRFFSALSVGA